MIRQRIARRLRRFARQQGGMVAVEFAMIAPIMMVMIYGMVELTDGILAKRRIGMAVSMVGDLTTNRADDWITEDELDQVFTVAEQVVSPYGFKDMEVTITVLRQEEDEDTPRVVWSRKRLVGDGDDGGDGDGVGDGFGDGDDDGEAGNDGGGAGNKTSEGGYERDSKFTKFAPGTDGHDYLDSKETLVAEGQNIIVAEITYPFESRLTNVFLDDFTLYAREVRAPRRQRTLRFCLPERNRDGDDEQECTDEVGEYRQDWDEDNCVPSDVAKNRCPKTGADSTS